MFFTDLAVYYALEHELAQRVPIIDLDVHQRNGSAHSCTFDPHVFTFSVHGAGNYPFYKERSSRDLARADGMDDDAYLELLAAGCPLSSRRSAPTSCSTPAAPACRRARGSAVWR